MALSVNTSRSLTGPKARLALVKAIRDAGANEPETHWLEWKSAADTAKKAWRGELASNILAFANRDPASAVRAVEGQAYLVVGAAPGELNGVTFVDPAELEDWLTPYVGGANGPAWNPDYVEIDGITVLLITVEAPRTGQPIWTLRKGFSNPSGTSYHAGQIFLRRNGQTVSQPTPAEIEMLQGRFAARGSELSIGLEIEDSEPIIALDVTDGARDRWLGWQREAMLSSLREVETEPSVWTVSSPMSEDRRTVDQYRQEVKDCLARSKEAFAGITRTHAVNKGIGLFRLTVVNHTQDNLQGLLIELKIEGRVHAFFSAHDALEAAQAPKRPIPYGEDTLLASIKTVPPSPGSMRHLVDRNLGHISNESSAWIKFPEIDLRPGYRHELADLYLLADSSECGSQLKARWLATSKSISGSLEGDFTIGVAVSPIEIEDLREPVDP